MYSQYIDGGFVPLESQRPGPGPGPAAPQGPPPAGPGKPAGLLEGTLGQVSRLLKGVLRTFSLDGIDTGDILLVLIILFLYLEGDDLEMVITLGLMLLFGLGKDGQSTE